MNYEVRYGKVGRLVKSSFIQEHNVDIMFFNESCKIMDFIYYVIVVSEIFFGVFGVRVRVVLNSGKEVVNGFKNFGCGRVRFCSGSCGTKSNIDEIAG